MSDLRRQVPTLRGGGGRPGPPVSADYSGSQGSPFEIKGGDLTYTPDCGILIVEIINTTKGGAM